MVLLSRRSSLVVFNLLVCTVVIAAHTAPLRGYQADFYASLGLWTWIALAASLLLATAIAFRRLLDGLYATATASVVLVMLPTIVTGEVYGTDSYVKAGRALRLLNGEADALSFLYPAMDTHAAAIAALTGHPLVSTGPMIGAALLAPFAAVLFGRVIGVRTDHLKQCLPLAALLPLGFGVWLSTLSTYHNYYLALPIAVVFIGVVLRALGQASIRYRALALGLGFITLLYHPLAFLGAVLVVGIVGIASQISGDRKQLATTVRRRAAVLTVLLAPLVIYLLWFSFAGNESWFVLNIFNMAGVVTSGGTGMPTRCVPSPTLDRCGVVFLSRLGVVLGVLGTAVGVTGVVILDRLRSRWQQGRWGAVPTTALALVGCAVGIFGVWASGVVGRNLLIRLLSYVVVTGLPGLFLAGDRARGIRPAPRIAGVYVGLGVLAAVTIAWVFGGNIRIVAIIASLIGTVTLAAAITQTAPERVPAFSRVAVAVLVLASVPVLYPSPATNGLPNPAPASETFDQYLWVGDNIPDDAALASGQLGWKLYRYTNPGEPIELFRSSRWRFNLLARPESVTMRAASRTFAGVRSDEPAAYIIYREYNAVSNPAVYIANETQYSVNLPVEREAIRASHPYAGEIYTAGNNTVYIT